jgi:ABC-type phosphate transport system substrate-binding protein
MLRNRRLRWLLGLLAALSLLAAACGDDDGGSSSSGEGGASSDGEAAALPTCLDFPAIYALMGPESTAATWAEAAPLAEELGSVVPADEFPDEPLTIFGPGEESGTFDSFAELALEGISEEQGVPEENWLPRPDYQSSPNDNVIIEGIGGTEGSLGWVGYAFYEENTDVVRAFELAGEDGTCVAPTNEAIAAGDYPLARDLYIYVNVDKASENPAVQAYVDYYLGDDGYAAVAEAGYVQLDEAAWGETGSAWEGAGGTPGAPEEGVSGEVVVSGSSTVEPISSLVGESFSAANPDAGISIDGPGTGDGFELFCGGETDISDASRPIEEEEAAACEDAGINFVELKVGIDGITVLTQA